MNRSRLLGVLIYLHTGITTASLIDTTSTWDGTNSVGSFGEGSTDTYGQTFIVKGTDVALNSFSFWMDDKLTPDTVDFAAYVMEWVDSVGLSAAHATGPILYQSPQTTTTNNGGLGGMEQFTFNTGSLPLESNKKYVAFLSSSMFWDGINGGAEVGTNLLGVDVYTGGEFVLQSTGNNFDPLITEGGWNVANQDLAFSAEFSPIPLPASLWLFGSGLLGLIGMARRRCALLS